MLSTSIPICLTSVTSCATSVTSRATSHARRHLATMQQWATMQLGWSMMFSCHTSCYSLSLKPWGKSRSFLVHRSTWLKLPHIQKIVTLAPISWPWENFLVSISTKSFPWKRTSPYFFRAHHRPPCQVWPLSPPKWRSSFRTNAATDTTQIIVRYPMHASLITNRNHQHT